jgi:hypothetical protein
LEGGRCRRVPQLRPTSFNQHRDITRESPGMNPRRRDHFTAKALAATLAAAEIVVEVGQVVAPARQSVQRLAERLEVRLGNVAAGARQAQRVTVPDHGDDGVRRSPAHARNWNTARTRVNDSLSRTGFATARPCRNEPTILPRKRSRWPIATPGVGRATAPAGLRPSLAPPERCNFGQTPPFLELSRRQERDWSGSTGWPASWDAFGVR